MSNATFGLFKKFDDYLKTRGDRATPNELVLIVKHHLEERGIE